jgi:hypothetical protein
MEEYPAPPQQQRNSTQLSGLNEIVTHFLWLNIQFLVVDYQTIQKKIEQKIQQEIEEKVLLNLSLFCTLNEINSLHFY